jgi:hypothetical protein
MAKTNNPALSSLIKQLQIMCAETGCGFRFHGDDDTVSRPDGWASVLWVGSVPPLNALDGDTWVDLTT